MSWFTPAELERAEAYHRPLARAELAATIAELLLLLVAAARSTGPTGPTGYGPGAAAQVGMVAAAAGFVPRLAMGLWRELRHEPARGLVARPEDRVGAPAVAVVVVLDEVLQVLGRAVLCGAGVGLLAWWSACAPVVGLAAIPAAIAVAVGLGSAVERVWRFRVDRVVEVPREALPPSLRAATQHVPVRWYRGGSAPSHRGEDGYVLGRRSCAVVVLSSEVLDGPPALLEAVAAHELGHVHALRRGRTGAAVRVVAVAVVAAGAGLVLGRHLAGAVPGLWFVAGVVVAGELAGAVWLVRRRHAEAAADRWAAAVVADPSACVLAVRLRLVQAGVDLAPRGLRRWRSAYPPASVRLDVLAGGKGPELVRPCVR